MLGKPEVIRLQAIFIALIALISLHSNKAIMVGTINTNGLIHPFLKFWEGYISFTFVQPTCTPAIFYLLFYVLNRLYNALDNSIIGKFSEHVYFWEISSVYGFDVATLFASGFCKAVIP